MYEELQNEIKYNEKELIKNIGIVLREEREKKRISRYNLANKLDISSTYIGFIEQGRYSISLFKFILIINELNLDANYVLEKAAEKMLNNEYKNKIKEGREEKNIIKEIMNYLKEYKNKL